MATDKELVKQLQQHLKNWNPEGLCNSHSEQHCTYDRQERLTRLHLCQLELTQIPREVWQLSSLQELDLSHNQLSTLPVEVGNLTMLQELDLSHNQLSTLPAEVGNLTTLQELNLSHNQFSTLPVEVGNLTTLQWLHLNNNQFSTLPAIVGNLTALQCIELDDNQLRTLPVEVGSLAALQELYLNNNQLSTLPIEVGNLATLQGLHLPYNQLSTLPVAVGNLTTLQVLDLNNNQLSTLPAEVGNLTMLQELHLDNNQLSTLPAEVGNLTTLQWLHLNNNQLSALPAEVGNLTTLQWLHLNNNPLQIPPEIVSQGTPAIFAYLQTLQRAQGERFEAKVILVGEGGMGKTSLLRGLRQQPFTQDLPATHGIEISTLHVPHLTRPQQEITLYTWDFGGQEIYQATHQFFLTQRSIYLLVWDARRGAENCCVSSWLDIIQGHAPDAKILLVATHTDTDLGKTPFFSLASYQQRFPQIVGLCAVSNKTGEGLDNLKTKIAEVAAQTPFVGQTWPRTWVQAEQQLLTRPEHHIDYATFAVLCNQHKIEDETERETFGRYLHDLGKILYFHDDPVLKTLIVLKPNWISKAISRVLLDPHVQQSGGVLEHRELTRIWSTDEQGQPYPHALYPIFIRMMERFALCYQLEPERPGQPSTQSLIPQLLPDLPPASLPPISTVPGPGQILVEMRYTLSFVPAGLMSWFLIRTHRYSQHQHWRDGARLAYSGQQAHIELDPLQREISLQVWGPFPYTFLLILKQTLDDLLSTFQGLRVQRKIPCRCSLQQQTPHTHIYEDLERQLTRGQSEITCSEGMRISLATLLYGIHISTTPQMLTTVQKTQQLITQNLTLNQGIQQRQISDEELRRILIRLDQGQEYIYRTLLIQDQQKLKLEQEKLNKSCPGLFILERGSRSTINPHDWVSRGYRLRLLCQYPQGPHTIPGEQGYEVRQGKEWWNTMSPWLRRIVKVLEVGMPLGKTINEGFKLVDIDRFTPDLDVFKEILDDLPEIKEIDALSNAQLNAQVQTMQQLDGAALRVLFHFLDTADPSHRWHGLSPIIADDGTILWLCDHHRQSFEARPITGI